MIFQIRGKVRGSEITSHQKSLNDFGDNKDLVAMCIIRLRVSLLKNDLDLILALMCDLDLDLDIGTKE